MSWREQQVAATREKIVDTFLELSSEPSAEPATVAAVARASGVAPATIYRHFPTRDDLVAAAGARTIRSDVAAGGRQWSTDDLRAHLASLWSDLAGNLAVTREAALSEAGRELRLARYRHLRAGLRAALESDGIDPDGPESRNFVAIVALVASVHAFLDLHDRQGLTPEEAAGAAHWAVTTLAGGIGFDPGHDGLFRGHDEEARP